MKPIDQDAVRRAALECGLLVRVENHSVVGGLGGAVCEVIVDEVPCRVKCLDFPDVFLESGDD